MGLSALITKNIGNLRQCADSPSDLAALISYKLRSARLMYLPWELNRPTYGWNETVHPSTLSVETTSKCNASCTMCPRTELGLKILEPIREELLDYTNIYTLMRKTPHTVFNPSGFGEPLTDPNVPAYIRMAHNRGKLTRLTTNASLLDTSKAEALMSAGLDMFIVSIDACDETTYHKIRRGLNWEQTRQNLTDLKEIRSLRNFRTYIQINIVVNSINKNGIQQIVDYWHPHVDNIRTLKEARHWKHIRRVEDEPLPIRKCFAPWETMIVFSNGDVPLCCRDVEGEYILGNVLDDDPVGVWNSEFARSVRKTFVKGDGYPEICHYCENPIVHEYFPDRKGKMQRINTVRRDLA
jgi:MoaA/NifB/PqqE/SkfB family radical SAM enzyme